MFLLFAMHFLAGHCVVVTASCNNMFVKKESMRTFLFDAWISAFSICISLLVIV